ncbi:unnamed protein product [Oncorhynchus mykiss]|uniref:Homeobox domain-containing protein n=1 Tax=Oncorhynchus mykiss TaxID=8022 RepID=A0A060WQP3_ONCMY|nr:unnamed protein product [Oncorhynchus mykiss]
MKESSQCEVTWTENEGKHASLHFSKTSHYQITNGKSNLSSDPSATDSDVNGGVSFSTNHNSVVCLPLVSEGLKLVWTQSDQTRELDTIPELVQAFNVFPYPTSREVNALARLCALPLDKVKVWFMVQRIKYGISWASEEIEETRRKLAGPERTNDNANEKEIKIRNGYPRTLQTSRHCPTFQFLSPTPSGFILLPPSSGTSLEMGLTTGESKNESQQLRPLPLVAHRPRDQENGAEMQGRAQEKGARSNGVKDSHFFQNFLSNSLEAFGEGAVGVEAEEDEVAEEASPLHFRGSKNPEIKQPPSATKEQLDILKEHFLRCQWPKSEDYTQLVELTGLPRADVSQWFGDTRYAVKNGQLRWVQGVREQFREQFLAELATQQNGSGGNGSSGTPRVTGSRKRKSQVNGATAPTSTADSPDINPLEVYHRSTGVLHEKDLDALCKKSRMSYQQVRDWFASQESKAFDPEANVTD